MSNEINLLLNEYKEERECDYKGEYYSVRDNGAVMRHTKEGNKSKKLDNVWTFGKKNELTGYMMFGNEGVHRIVAKAFHADTYDSKLIVDHIDTNRSNNRPENLRCITKLENVLKNPITKKKISYLCGSVENFLKDPAKYRSVLSQHQDVRWMITESKEEANNCRENLERWTQEDGKREGSEERREIGSWIFQKHTSKEEIQFDKNTHTLIGDSSITEMMYMTDPSVVECRLKDSLTPLAKQRNWKTYSVFPLCPQTISEKPLEDYRNRLKKNSVFSRNIYSISKVYGAIFCQKESSIIVGTYFPSPINDYKFALAKITFEDGYFIHESQRMFKKEKAFLEIFSMLENRMQEI